MSTQPRYHPVDFAFGQPTTGDDVTIVFQGNIGAIRLTPQSFYRTLASLAPCDRDARAAWWATLQAKVAARSPAEGV